MRAVIYREDGGIVLSLEGQQASIAATSAQMGMPYLEVTTLCDDYDRTHRVESGQLVEIA